MADFLELDGAYGEGGGQVLRTALTLAVLTQQPLHLYNIRAGRPSPGLAPQHLTTVLAAAKLCQAEVEGARLGSTELWFTPTTTPQAGAYMFDVSQVARGGSAGSVTLIFQTVLLPLVYAAGPSQVTLKGGTHVPWSPSYDYIVHVFLPTLGRMGVRATCHLDAWGMYPAGGGQMRVEIDPLPPGENGSQTLTPLTLLERGPLRRVGGQGVALNLPADIAQRLANRANNVLRSRGVQAEMMPRRVGGPGIGAGIFLVAEYKHTAAGFAALGAKGKPADQVADEACDDLLAHHTTGAAVDPHLADQLLLPMALAAGPSAFQTSQVTQHLLTNAYMIQQFLAVNIDIHGQEGQAGQVTVKPTSRP